jgi:hypothetical protein
MDQTDNTVHRAVLIAAQALRQMGFTVDVVAMDWSTLIQRRASKAPPAQGGWNVFLTNATATGVENPLVNNFVKNCAEAWYHWACDQRHRRSQSAVGARGRSGQAQADHRRIAARASRERHAGAARHVSAHDHLSQGTRRHHSGTGDLLLEYQEARRRVIAPIAAAG